MEFSVKSGSPEKQRECLSSWASSNHVAFLRLQNSSIKSAMGTSAPCYVGANWKENRGRHCCCTMLPNVLSERILLIGCGKERELDQRQYKQVIQKTINTLNDTGSMEAVCFSGV